MPSSTPPLPEAHAAPAIGGLDVALRALRARGTDGPPRALIFDLDGTLIDSRVDIARACNAALMALGRAEQPVARIATYVGDGARMLVARALDEPPDGPLVDRGVAHFREAYEARPVVETTLLPGVAACLEAFADLPLAIATNKPRRATELVLDALRVRGRFLAVAAGGDGPLKPDPHLVLRALTAMGASAAETWMIGDSPQDVLAGRAAGTTTVGVPGFVERERLVAASPDALLPSLEDLPALRAALLSA